MAENKVKVRIYGQDYTISGERDEKDIIEVAEFVDAKMKEIAQCFPPSGVPGSLAVLACINIADEYYAHKHDNDDLKEKNRQLKAEVENYMKMWDEAKRSSAKYKEKVEMNSTDTQDLKKKIAELEARCSEFESSYFDVQMENIQLKDQIAKLKR